MAWARYARWTGRQRLAFWVGLVFAGLLLAVTLFDTARFLATRQIMLDTLLSAGLGETVPGTGIVANGCSRVFYPGRRSSSAGTVDYDCDINVAPAGSRSPVHRYRMRFMTAGQEHQGIEVARLGGQTGVRWPLAVIAGAWLEVPSLMINLVLVIVALAVAVTVYRRPPPAPPSRIIRVR